MGTDEDGRRWRPRPWQARSVRAVAFLLPFLAAVAAGLTVGAFLPEWSGFLGLLGWWVVVAAVSTVTMVAVDQLARRLLPLAALLRLSMLFPDEAPSRLQVARRGAGTRALAGELSEAQQQGLRGTRQEAAETILGLVSALTDYHSRTRGHSERVHLYVTMLADEMGLKPHDRDRLVWAALVHDIGKLVVPVKVLNKPGPPDDDEWETIRQHPEAGAAMCEPLREWLGPWFAAVGQHHEKYDGTGYPRGLAGEDISLGARIVAVADAYEVMTAARPYKKPMTAEEARAELTRCAGTHFDPVAVRAFLRLSLRRLRAFTGPLTWFAELPFAPQLTSKAGSALLAGAGAAATVGTVAVLGVSPATGAGSDGGSPAAAAADGAAGSGGAATGTGAGRLGLDDGAGGQAGGAGGPGAAGGGQGPGSGAAGTAGSGGSGASASGGNDSGTTPRSSAANRGRGGSSSGPGTASGRRAGASGQEASGTRRPGPGTPGGTGGVRPAPPAVPQQAPPPQGSPPQGSQPPAAPLSASRVEATTQEDTPRTLDVLPGVGPVSAGPFRLTSVGAPSRGTAKVDGDRVTYTPSPDTSGADEFTYVVQDAAGRQATGVVGMTVAAVNDAPVARDDTAATAPRMRVRIPVLANDSDPDGDRLQVSDVSTPQHGKAKGTTSSKSRYDAVTYRPDKGFTGTDTFTYRVTDGTTSALATVTVEVVDAVQPSSLYLRGLPSSGPGRLSLEAPDGPVENSEDDGQPGRTIPAGEGAEWRLTVPAGGLALDGPVKLELFRRVVGDEERTPGRVTVELADCPPEGPCRVFASLRDHPVPWSGGDVRRQTLPLGNVETVLPAGHVLRLQMAVTERSILIASDRGHPTRLVLPGKDED